MTIYIKADKFYYAHEIKPAGYLAISDGIFGHWQKYSPIHGEILDYTGYQIAPGLVDTHIHGFGGVDVMDNSHEGIFKTMSEGLLSTGVTSWLPTTLTSTFNQLKEVCKTIGTYFGSETGAKILGLYFEGPYFTEEFKGAQNPNYMSDPSISDFEAWQLAAKGHILKIALAPERKGTSDFIKYVRDKGVYVALGHSNATLSEATNAVADGATIWVHAYNGMRGFNHREPGMVGAVYSLPDTFAELICDGHHVHPQACNLLMQHKGHDYIALITDCMRAGGMPDGNYVLGDFPVIVKDGTARLADSGNLAGSILTLHTALKNVINWEIATPHQAINMASFIPAKSLGLDNKCGQIKQGLSADFIVLDRNYDLIATYLDGKKRYENVR